MALELADNDKYEVKEIIGIVPHLSHVCTLY